MMSATTIAVYLLLQLLVSSALGEVQLICPPSLTKDSQFTELTPGPKTIVFRQTNAREGSPFRLSVYRGQTECVLLDHIPYQMDSNMYYITVDIPDITCTRSQNCRMVLMQMDTNGYCMLSSCTQYSSTAPITIRSSGTGSNSCPNPRNPYRLYNWPYDPSRPYIASLASSTSSGRASGMFVIIGNTLLYNVTLTTSFSDPTTRRQALRFFYYTQTNSTVTIATITIDNANAWNAGSWTGFTAFARNLVTTSSMYISIVTSTSTSDITGLIGPTSNSNPRVGLYGKEYGTYSPGGWLNGEWFIGNTANATFFAKPTGSCINVTRFFGCILDSSHPTGGGTVGVAVTGLRTVFSIDMFNVSSSITRVLLKGVAANSLDMTPYWSDGYHIDGVTDISDILQTRIFAGLANIEISTIRGSAELKCNLEEGIISMLDARFEKPAVTTPTNGTGTVFAYLSVDGTLSVQITVNELSSLLVKAHLHAPAIQGIPTSSIPFDLTSYIMGQNRSSWNVFATLKNVSGMELRYFIEGLYYVNMHTQGNPNGELRGQLSIPGKWLCPSTFDILTNQCKFVWLSPSVFMTNTSIQPYGVGAVVIDRIQRLQYSISIWNAPAGNDLTINLVASNGRVLNTVTDTQTSQRRNVQEVNVVYPSNFDENLSEDVLQQAANGRLALNVTTPNYPGSYLYGTLPPIERNRCSQQPYIIQVGTSNGTHSGWTQNQIYQPIRLQIGDILRFNFTAPDNVYLMENRNRYTGCIFGTATLLNDTTGVYDFHTTNVGHFYFASSSDCDDQQRPMKFPVYVVDKVENTMDSNMCSLSLYTYASEQRYITAASTGTLSATVAGLVIGIIIVAIVITVMVVLLVRRRSTGASVDLPVKA